MGLSSPKLLNKYENTDNAQSWLLVYNAANRSSEKDSRPRRYESIYRSRQLEMWQKPTNQFYRSCNGGASAPTY